MSRAAESSEVLAAASVLVAVARAVVSDNVSVSRTSAAHGIGLRRALNGHAVRVGNSAAAGVRPDVVTLDDVVASPGAVYQHTGGVVGDRVSRADGIA